MATWHTDLAHMWDATGARRLLEWPGHASRMAHGAGPNEPLCRLGGSAYETHPVVDDPCRDACGCDGPLWGGLGQGRERYDRVQEAGGSDAWFRLQAQQLHLRQRHLW